MFADEEALREAMQGFEGLIGTHLGVVSLDLPLISNLDAWANIALIRQYHENLPRAKAEAVALGCLGRYGMEAVAYKRNPALSHEERFCVMLLRAAAMRNATVVIDRPFLIIPHLKEARWVCEALDIASDLYDRCYVFDYVWNKERYGMIDEAES